MNFKECPLVLFHWKKHPDQYRSNPFKCHNGNKFIIFSDSLSSLIAIQNRLWDILLVLETLEKIHNLTVNGKTVVLVWLPSHVGVKGNSDADMAAKSALIAAPGNILVPHYNFRQHIHQYFKWKWQTIWDSQIDNKLHKIKPNIGITYFRSQLDQRKEQILHRLWIGHTYLTHAILLKRENKPYSGTCNCPLTVEHILLCSAYNAIRSVYFTALTLKGLFENTNSLHILDFI